MSAVSPDVTLLFQREASGVTYRIPALLYIEEANLFLAFAEKRSSPSDDDALYLVMRRGVEDHGTLQWEDAVAVSNAELAGHRTMNPCPIYDRDTKTIFLFFICVLTNQSECWQITTGRNAARVCYITSADYGKSWSSLIDVTEAVLAEDLENCSTVAVGPGHGIQSSSGRLIVPAYLYYIHSRVCGFAAPCKTKPHSFVFYSDDHGKKWHRGGTIWQQPTGECQVAQVVRSNGLGVLYCNARTTKHYRVEATSTDQSLSFANSYYCKQLCEPPNGCQGSVVSYRPSEIHHAPEEPGANSDNRTSTWLLFSHPTSKRERLDLGIYLNKSPLVANSWTQPWVIHKGPSGYSDLAVCQAAHTFACFYECGANATEMIAFRRFSVEEVIDNL